MTDSRYCLDTNILIYAFDKSAGKKQLDAIKILMHAPKANTVLTLQSLAEFYYCITRKNLDSSETACEQINDWKTLFPIVFAQPDTLTKAIKLKKKHTLSFWDALLVSTARDAGVNTLISEDLNHSQMIAGIRIHNPFNEPLPFTD